MAEQLTIEETETCPRCGAALRKVYNFGNRHVPDAEVFTYQCGTHFVSVKHDPVGQYPSVTRIHHSYGEAAGVARLHRMMADAKYG